MSEQLSQQEQFDKLKDLADKHLELKKTITIMLNDLDKIEVEFRAIKKSIKKA